MINGKLHDSNKFMRNTQDIARMRLHKRSTHVRPNRASVITGNSRIMLSLAARQAVSLAAFAANFFLAIQDLRPGQGRPV